MVNNHFVWLTERANLQIIMSITWDMTSFIMCCLVNIFIVIGSEQASLLLISNLSHSVN